MVRNAAKINNHMGNSKHAYGWSGHILVSKDDLGSSSDHNVIAVPQSLFSKLVYDYQNCKLDARIRIKKLGALGHSTSFLAAGANFSDGFTHYGTVFEYAELRAEGQPLTLYQDGDYLKAMKEIYGLDLPPCRLMVGCSSEH